MGNFWVLGEPELSRLGRAREHVNRTADQALTVKRLGLFLFDTKHRVFAAEAVGPIQAGVEIGDGYYDGYGFLHAQICA